MTHTADQWTSIGVAAMPYLRTQGFMTIPDVKRVVVGMRQCLSVLRTGGLRAMPGWAAKEEDLRMTCRLLRHCCFTDAGFCRQLWAILYERQNSQLRTVLRPLKHGEPHQGALAAAKL